MGTETHRQVPCCRLPEPPVRSPQGQHTGSSAISTGLPRPLVTPRFPRSTLRERPSSQGHGRRLARQKGDAVPAAGSFVLGPSPITSCHCSRGTPVHQLLPPRLAVSLPEGISSRCRKPDRRAQVELGRPLDKRKERSPPIPIPRLSLFPLNRDRLAPPPVARGPLPSQGPPLTNPCDTPDQPFLHPASFHIFPEATTKITPLDCPSPFREHGPKSPPRHRCRPLITAAHTQSPTYEAGQQHQSRRCRISKSDC